MSYNGILEDLKKCSLCQTPSRVPILPITLEFDMRCANMTYRQNRTDMDKIIKMNLDAATRFNYDWSLIFPDDYIEWEPFGLDMLDEEDIPVTPRKYLPATCETLDNMIFPDIQKDGRMPFYLECQRRVKEKLPPNTLLGGRVAAPFTSVGLLFGTDSLLLGMIDDPQLIKDTMEKLSEYIINWGLAQREVGVDVLWIGDCLSSSQFISPPSFADLAAPYIEKIALELKKSGLFLIYHNSEKSIAHIKMQADLASIDAINLGEGIDLAEIKELTGHKKCLMGNIDPLGILRDSTPDIIRQETTKMIEKNKQGGGYIFCTSEGTTQNTPVKNIEAMMEAAAKAAVY